MLICHLAIFFQEKQHGEHGEERFLEANAPITTVGPRIPFVPARRMGHASPHMHWNLITSEGLISSKTLDHGIYLSE